MFAMEARFWLVPYAALVWWPEICMERGADTRRASLPPGGVFSVRSNGLIGLRGLRLPGKPVSSLRGLLRRAFQAFARSLDLRISCTVTSRPHFRCRS
jgi:hypothetical protein